MDGSLLGEDLDGILAALPASSLDYQEWVGVGMALKAEGYGCEVWDAWSAADAARYHAGECERKWRSFGDGGEGRVNGGTLVQMAMERGYEPPGWGDDEAFGWDLAEADPWDGPGAPGGREWRTTRQQQQGQAKPANIVVDPTWLEGEELREPEGDAWHPADQLTRYLSALFDPEDIVGYVTAAFERDGRWTPAGKGDCTRTAGEIIQQLAKYGDDLSYTLGQPNAEAGAWIRFNPLDGQGVRNDNVAEFRYALVESDEMAPGRQMAIMRALELPIAAVVHSGNKSVHAIVRVDAKDYDEYRKRVDFLYRTCQDNGLKLDTQNKNPSRLSRMPGVERAGRRQWLVAESMGRASWKDWREWLDEQNDDLPDPETLDRTWDDMPELAPPLIEGVLRQGHKMLLAGPSKAGKSFALIALTVAIAEGLEWFGWRCAQGRVMYVNLELDRASCLHRFRDVYAAMGARPDNLANVAVWNLRGKSKPMDQLAPALIRRAAKERPIAVIIDPIYKVITGDENSADQMAAFCNQFDKVADGLGCAVIYCHHHSKGAQGGKRSMDRASGSGVFARDPDALLDMLELHVSDELRDQLEARAVGQQAAGFMNANAARLGGGWRAEVPEDDLAAGGDKLMAACRSIVQARAGVDQGVPRRHPGRAGQGQGDERLARGGHPARVPALRAGEPAVRLPHARGGPHGASGGRQPRGRGDGAHGLPRPGPRAQGQKRRQEAGGEAGGAARGHGRLRRGRRGRHRGQRGGAHARGERPRSNCQHCARMAPQGVVPAESRRRQGHEGRRAGRPRNDRNAERLVAPLLLRRSISKEIRVTQQQNNELFARTGPCVRAEAAPALVRRGYAPPSRQRRNIRTNEGERTWESSARAAGATSTPWGRTT